MVARFLFLMLISICIFETLGLEGSFKVRLNKNGQFIDSFGRIRMFHGFNSVTKQFPWYDDQMLNQTKLNLYKTWGFNVVRLGTMWAGVQPNDNAYNETYLTILKDIVNKLDQFGMYTFLDMHQDVLSSRFSTYDGIPLWLLDKFPQTPNQYQFPFPFKPNSTHFWSDYYITYAACDAYSHLYKTEIGLSEWANFWIKIAGTFKNFTSIMGYELINEPWVGNFYQKPELLLPGYAGKFNLLPAYDRLVDAIRTLDNDTLIFYEPVTLGAYLPTTGNLGTGFNRVPGTMRQTDKSVLSYHYYCFFLTTAKQEDTYPPWLRVICDEILAKTLFKSVLKDTKETGGGLILTEFGGCVPDGNPESINTVECDAVLKLADEYYQSYTYWDSIFFDNNGDPLPKAIETFARTYPTALQGQPISYSFDRISSHFELVYTIDLNIMAQTEIFIPITVHYPQGFTNTTTPLMITSFNISTFTLSVYPNQGIKQDSTITIKIDPVSKI